VLTQPAAVSLDPATALLRLVHVEDRTVPPLPPAVWDRVLDLAAREQMSPLVASVLDERCRAPVPDHVRASLHEAHARSAARAGAVYAQLAEVLADLGHAGIPAVLIKGVGLARFVYPDSALRPFTDIDLLVREDDRVGARQVLRRVGYVEGGPTSGPGPSVQGQDSYYDPSWKRLPIDVHWRYGLRPINMGLDYRGVLARTTMAALGPAPALFLSPADMVVALSAHFLKHLWFGMMRLRYLRDVAEVVRRAPVDWTCVRHTVQEAPLVRGPLRLTLAAASSLIGAAVPAGIIEDLRSRRSAGLEQCVEDRIVGHILQREAPLYAVLQVAALRWLDGTSPIDAARLMRSLLGTQRRRLAAYIRRRTIVRRLRWRRWTIA
jgi:hypothetical protein